MATTPVDAYRVARPLVSMKKYAEALAIFSAASEKWPGQWPLDVGFLRAYAGLGEKNKAITAGKKALWVAPDEPNRKNIENMLKKVEAGEPLE